MARTPAQNAAIYAARQARAQAAGFSGYSEQRRLRAEAVRLDPGLKGGGPKGAARRDEVAKVIRDYQPGQRITDVHATFTAIDPDYFDDDYFDSDEWYDLLDDLSGEVSG